LHLDSGRPPVFDESLYVSKTLLPETPNAAECVAPEGVKVVNTPLL
jgi:hypothetical protein